MTLILTLLLACGNAPAPDGHDHEGDHAHEHDGEHVHGDGAAPHEDAHHDVAHDEKAGAADGPIEAPLGAYTARLEPSADSLRLVVLDGAGQAVNAEGKAKVILTGTGEGPQRVVLTADGEAWAGKAKAEGAPGYLAVVNVSVGGNQESARLTWGTVPEAAPAPAPAEEQGGHGHDHGEGADHQH